MVQVKSSPTGAGGTRHARMRGRLLYRRYRHRGFRLVDGPNGGISAVRGAARSVVSDDDKGYRSRRHVTRMTFGDARSFRDCSLLALNIAWRALFRQGDGWRMGTWK
jgi:hypothetical protein